MSSFKYLSNKFNSRLDVYVHVIVSVQQNLDVYISNLGVEAKLRDVGLANSYSLFIFYFLNYREAGKVASMIVFILGKLDV